MIWTYQATVSRFIDADTLVVSLDMGMDVWHLQQRVRIAHINAPELVTPEGKAALAFVQALVPVGAKVTLVSHKWDLYGRLLCEVKYGEVDVATALLTNGHAVAYEGR